MKKTLTGRDANLLALFARGGYLHLSTEEINDLLGTLSCEDARKIAQAIINEDTTNEAAKAFMEWAGSLSK